MVTISSANTISSRVRPPVKTRRNPEIRRMASRALFLLSARLVAKTGVNAEVRAPSATKLRRRFGMRKATKKASAKIDVPRRRATSRSLIKPRIRLMRVSEDTIAVPRSSTDEILADHKAARDSV